MALIECSVCGAMISPNAQACPKCGEPMVKVQPPPLAAPLSAAEKKRILAEEEELQKARRKTAANKRLNGCGAFLICLVAYFFISSVFRGAKEDMKHTPSRSSSGTATAATAVQDSAPKVLTFALNQPFNIGYTSYCVYSATWTDHISNNSMMDKAPNAHYLFVDVSVKNEDKEARTIPPFYLIDENGAQYEETSSRWAADNTLGLIESLNPGVGKRGYLVFDCPSEHKYQLKVSGGFWSGESALVPLQ